MNHGVKLTYICKDLLKKIVKIICNSLFLDRDPNPTPYA